MVLPSLFLTLKIRVSFILIVFDQNGSDCREKFYVSVKNYNPFLWVIRF